MRFLFVFAFLFVDSNFLSAQPEARTQESREADLIVLSSCESGTGREVYGEGVLSLRDAV